MPKKTKRVQRRPLELTLSITIIILLVGALLAKMDEPKLTLFCKGETIEGISRAMGNMDTTTGQAAILILQKNHIRRFEEHCDGFKYE